MLITLDANLSQLQKRFHAFRGFLAAFSSARSSREYA
jgi:hypothetical protein